MRSAWKEAFKEEISNSKLLCGIFFLVPIVKRCRARSMKGSFWGQGGRQTLKKRMTSSEGRQDVTYTLLIWRRDPPKQGRGLKTSKCSPRSPLEVGLKWLIVKEFSVRNWDFWRGSFQLGFFSGCHPFPFMLLAWHRFTIGTRKKMPQSSLLLLISSLKASFQ